MQEKDIENEFIQKLVDLKYTHRTDITDLDALEANFRRKFEALNQVKLTESEFERLLARIVLPDVFACADILRNRTSFERDDGTPLNFALVNIKDWCKNSFEVVSQLRINTLSSHHVYDVVLLLNGVPVVQVELKNLQVSLPLISDVLDSPAENSGFDLLYIGPLKALISDQAMRLKKICREVELPVVPWHGDISQSVKTKAMRNPRGIVLITPESLEALFVRRGLEIPRLFGATRVVVIDELHSVFDSERGVQMRSLLKALSKVEEAVAWPAGEQKASQRRLGGNGRSVVRMSAVEVHFLDQFERRGAMSGQIL